MIAACAQASRVRRAIARHLRSRHGTAVGVGLLVAIYCALSYTLRLGPGEANDFTVHWYAARALLDGGNPYDALHVGSRTIYGGLYYYPLPATMLAAPVSWLPIKAAAVVFASVGAAVLAYALSGKERWRLAALLSAPMLSTAAAGQNTAFVTAAALAPGLGWLAAAKPNVGLAVLAMNPSRRAVGGALLFALVSLLLLPTWPRDWLRAISADPGYHVAPVLVPGGVVLLLALTRWRRPEARLVVALACVPHTMTWYDALPLMLVPSTYRQLLLLGILSHVASFTAAAASVRNNGPELFAATAPIALWGLYVPAMILVLFRPNRGDIPGWMERAVAGWPGWVRGARATSEPTA